MSLQQQIMSILTAVCIFAFIINLVRNKKIQEKFSIIWLVSGLIIVILAIWEKPFALISLITGIKTPTSIAFFFGILFLLMIILQLTIELSRTRDEIKILTQKIAILESKIKDTL
jgi:hypothetical protein